jgi:hypothetical protein
MYYIKGQEQQDKCLYYKLQARRWNMGIILKSLGKKKLDFRSIHYWWGNLLKLLGGA